MSLRTFSESDATPDKLVIYAQKGFGKTTLGAQAPKPVFLMSRDELGLLTLMRNGLVPPAPYSVVQSWEQFEVELRELIVKGCGDAQTLVLDALGGFNRLCDEYICNKEHGGKWGKNGFMNYHVGYAQSAVEFTRMLGVLSEVNTKLKLRIIMLAHSQVEKFEDPMTAPFDRFTVDCHRKTWQPVNAWADAVLFGRTITTKGKGGLNTELKRVVHTCECDAFEAKNRHGLPRQIEMPDTPAGMWDAIGGPLAAAVKMGPAPAAPADDGAKWDAAMMELTMLVQEHKIDLSKLVPWAATKFKRTIKTLDELTIDEIATVTASVRAKYQKAA